MSRLMILALLLCSVVHAQIHTDLPELEFFGTYNNPPINDGTVMLDGVAFYVWDDGVHGAELWRSDGTPQGTFMLKDLTPGRDGSTIYDLKALAGQITFRQHRPSNAARFFESDGTVDGTLQVHEGHISDPSFNLGGALYYTISGRLYRHVYGESSSTQLATNVSTLQAADSYICWLDNTDGQLKATDGNTTWEIGIDRLPSAILGDILIFAQSDFAIADGTANSYSILEVGLITTNWVMVDGKIFCLGALGNPDTLWVSDLTPDGTMPLDGGYPWEGTTFTSQTDFGVGLGGLFFLHGDDLMFTDGTVAGTRTVFASTANRSISFPKWMAGTDTHYYVQVLEIDSGTANHKIYQTDGTTITGTFPAVNSLRHPIFASDAGLSYQTFYGGYGWRVPVTLDHDLTAITPLGPVGEIAADPVELDSGLLFRTPLGRLIFRGHDGHEVELVGSDQNITAAYLDSTGPRAYFIDSGQVWETDGTVAGTRNLNIRAQSLFTFPNQVVAFNGVEVIMKGAVDMPAIDTIFLRAGSFLTYVNGTLFWHTSDSWTLNYLIPGEAGQTINLFRPVVGRFQPVGDVLMTQNLVALDTKTMVVTSLSEDEPDLFEIDGDRAFYYFDHDTTGQLYETDGRTTELIYEYETNKPEVVRDIFRYKGDVYFVGSTFFQREALYKLEKGEAVPVLDLTTDETDGDLDNFVVHDGLLYFTVYEAAAGDELWRTDGTPEGTRRVTDLNPGMASSAIRNLKSTAAGLIYMGFDGTDWVLNMIRNIRTGMDAPRNVCDGGTVVLTSHEDAPGMSYTWAATGATITSGQGTRTVTLENITGANLEVSLTMELGLESATASWSIPVVNTAPATPGALSGATTVCAAASGVSYAVPLVSGVTYEWELPTGAAIVGATDGNAVVVDFASAGGTLRVRAVNSCGTSAWSELEVAISDVQPAHAGGDIHSCDETVTLAASDPGSATGTWTILEGVGGSLGDAALATTTFTGLAGASYLLEWRVSDALCGESADTVRVTLAESVPTAEAGENITTCQTSVSLSANLPDGVFGVWEVLDDAGGSFDNPLDPNTTFHGEAGQTYVLRWSLYAKPCGASWDTLILEMEDVVVADAGRDGVIASNGSYGLNASGAGTWSILSGPDHDPAQLADPADPRTRFSPSGGPGSYVLQWAIENANCGASEDTVTVEALVQTPVPQLVATYGTKLDGDVDDFDVKAGLQKGNAFYFVANTDPAGFYREEAGEVTFLGAMQHARSVDVYIYDLGHGLMILGGGRHFYDFANGSFSSPGQSEQAHVGSAQVYNGALYWRAYSRIFRATGGEEGQQVLPLADLLAVWQGQLHFFAEGQVFAGNGTGAGSYSITPASNYDWVKYLGANDTHFFVAAREGDTTQLLALDGTGGEPVLLREVTQDDVQALGSLNGAVFFSLGYSGIENDDTLWRSEGSSANTSDMGIAIPNTRVRTTFENQLYFSGADHVWHTDGSIAGTQIVAVGGTDAFVHFGEKLMWSAAGRIQEVDSKGVTETVPALDGPLVGASGDHLLFEQGKDLHRTATAGDAGTAILKARDGAEVNQNDMAMLGTGLLFRYDNASGEQEAFHGTDGTEAGTSFLGGPGGGTTQIGMIQSKNGKALFLTDNETPIRLFEVRSVDQAPNLLDDDGLEAGSPFDFEPYGAGYLVSFQDGGLIRYEGGTKTTLINEEVRGPFGDPHSDEIYLLDGAGNLIRTSGDGSVRETVATLPDFGSLRDSDMVFGETHFFVYNDYSLWRVARADDRVTDVGGYNGGFIEPEHHQDDLGLQAEMIGGNLVYHHRRDDRLAIQDVAGNETLGTGFFGTPDAFGRMTDYVYAVTFHGLAVTQGDSWQTYSFPEFIERDYRVASFGNSLLVWTLDNAYNEQIYYFDSQGLRPLPGLVHEPEFLPLQGLIGAENRAYMVFADDENRSAIYKMDVGGPTFEDPRLLYYLLQRYDANGDGFLSWDEATAITVIDLSRGDRGSRQAIQNLGVRSLAGIEQLPNLSELYISGNPIQDISPILASGLGDEPGDVIDLDGALLNDGACTDLEALGTRVNTSGALLSYATQGGQLADLDPATWPTRTVLDLVSESFTPSYNLDCAQPPGKRMMPRKGGE